MKKILTAAMAVAVACAFAARAEDAVKEAPAKAESKPACAACPMAGAKADAEGKEAAVCPATKAKCAMTCHVLSIKDGKALCCACPKDCKCTVKEGETKCSCGKDVKTCDLKGMFVCDCAAGCTCNQISDKAGKCGCGKDYKEVK
jgi:hypothetical protein